MEPGQPSPETGPRADRERKLAELQALGVDPYPADSHRTHLTQEVRDHYGEIEGTTATIAGRLMARRGHGKLMFFDVQDKAGRLQSIVDVSLLGGTDPASGALSFEHVDRLVDRGDLVEISGEVTTSRRGEISLMASRVRMLAKAVEPLPDAWHGVTDPETLVRKRYLQSIVEPETRARFEVVSELLFGIRAFLHERGFLEFQTPVLQPLYGGGKARPFTTNVKALGRDYYLAISHELYLKRLVIAGFEDVFTIGRYFRNEGIDKTHNPEFSMLETMSAFHGYEFNMDLTEALYKHLAGDVIDKPVIEVKGQSVDLTGDWRRASMVDLVKEAVDVDFRDVTTLDEAERILTSHGVPAQPTVGHALVALFEAVVEPTLIQPTIVHGHPVEISPLAKATADDPRYVERFEVFVGGTEQGDNWTELNDPVELRRRFTAEQQRRSDGDDDEAHPLDFEFIEAMEHGMPPTTGLGPGIERLAMLLTETDDIGDVIYFPLVRPLQPPG
ncbi:MAG TPA: lysine--tRNA ligase [Iamia sp.]|nr:lysine--tRNA ligase [Iamia sp.]